MLGAVKAPLAQLAACASRASAGGKPKPVREEGRKTPTLREFAPRFLEGYAKANRLKPSGVSSKEVAIRVHLFPQFGDKRLNDITTEDVQQLKSAMVAKSPKTVNNVLTVLSVMLRTDIEWNVIERVPCTVKLLKAPKTTATFHDFEAYERLVEAARKDDLAYLIVLLGGEAGLRCGEIMALEWSNVDLKKRQMCVAQSEWKGHVTAPKGGRLRYVPLTTRLATALKAHRHRRGERVLCRGDGSAFTQKIVRELVRRAARRGRRERRAEGASQRDRRLSAFALA